MQKWPTSINMSLVIPTEVTVTTGFQPTITVLWAWNSNFRHQSYEYEMVTWRCHKEQRWCHWGHKNKRQGHKGHKWTLQGQGISQNRVPLKFTTTWLHLGHKFLQSTFPFSQLSSWLPAIVFPHRPSPGRDHQQEDVFLQGHMPSKVQSISEAIFTHCRPNHCCCCCCCQADVCNSTNDDDKTYMKRWGGVEEEVVGHRESISIVSRRFENDTWIHKGSDGTNMATDT